MPSDRRLRSANDSPRLVRARTGHIEVRPYRTTPGQRSRPPDASLSAGQTRGCSHSPPRQQQGKWNALLGRDEAAPTDTLKRREKYRC
jgi:hypothetical protein